MLGEYLAFSGRFSKACTAIGISINTSQLLFICKVTVNHCAATPPGPSQVWRFWGFSASTPFLTLFHTYYSSPLSDFRILCILIKDNG